jgi:hypothetical protein
MTKISLRVDAPGDEPALRSLFVLRELCSMEETREQHVLCRGRSNHQGGGLVSLKSSLWRYLGLLAVAALAVGVFAGPASAKKMSAKQRAAISKQLRKQVKKNPGIVNKKSFIKRASLVNFKLPVTLRLRGATTNANPNRATVDLGASLGQREIDLGGNLAAEITFHDSYDGGALGNVDLDILPSATKALTSTSIPLLWNSQVSQAGTSWDSDLLAGSAPAYSALFPAGCGNVHSGGANVNSNGNMQFGFGAGPQPGGPANLGAIGAGGLPGVPIYSSLISYGTGGSPTHFAPAHVGTGPAASVGDINHVAANRIPGVDDNVGGNPQPFPYSAQSTPGGFTQPPSASDTVLRTNALKLNIATPGTEVPQGQDAVTGDSINPDGVAGSQNLRIGKSGGQANLFGNIPGKSYGIDVTVNLATKINSILRVVDQDAFEPLITGGNWPAAVFSCGQVWTGAVQNYIPSVQLAGSLKIAPGITSDGKLRIAKATVSSRPGSNARFAVAACLAPYAAYNAAQGTSDTVAPTVPGPGSIGAADGTLALGSLPVDPDTARPAPAAACNADPTAFVKSTALPPSQVTSLSPAAPADGYTVNNSGSTVSVGADLNVSHVEIDVLVGDV